MLIGPVYAILAIAGTVAGLTLIAIARSMRWVLLAVFIYLALFETSWAQQQAESKWMLISITRDFRFVEHTFHHFTLDDCLNKAQTELLSARVRDDMYGWTDIVGVLCEEVEPEPPPLQGREMPKCLDPAEGCA